MKRQRHEEPENHERWLVSYADFITLLFAFFTVLYATSQQDSAKAKQFEESIRKYLSGLMSPAGSGEGSASQAGGHGVPSRTLLDPSAQPLPDVRGSVATVEAFVAEYLQKNIPKEEDQKKLVPHITTDAGGVRLRLNPDTQFISGSMALNARLKWALKQLAPLFRESGRVIQIEGHAWEEKNPALPTLWELSALRATQTLRYLTEKLDVPASQVSARGLGAQQPTNSADTQSNRRVELYITTQEVGDTH